MSNQLSLYRKTTLYLANLILNNLNQTNYQLPTESELASTQNISRITARKAYKELEDLHVIIRVKGKGTFIAPGTKFTDLDPILKDSRERTFKQIGAILPLYNSQHVMEINAAMSETCKDYKLLTAFSNMSQQNEQQLINEYIEMGVNGLVIYPVDNEIYNTSLVNLAISNFPVVLIDRNLPGLTFPTVMSDHKDMIRVALKHLTDNGHSHILLFNANIKTNSSLNERRDEYIKLLYDYGNYHNYFFNFEGDRDATSKSFATSFREYLRENPKITAIIAIDYSSGIHLLQLSTILGISFPDDYEAVFLDFKTPNNFLKTELPTYVEQNSFKIGFEAINLIKTQIENSGVKQESKTIPISLVQGYSTLKK